ncbi:Heat shock protein Hsp-16.48/Hsp-16.49 [Armadillidium vulgare]|nr:Heat shock protein Hsp-16.48/Hsp-16.49 [Armadillidium vulgare]
MSSLSKAVSKRRLSTPAVPTHSKGASNFPCSVNIRESTSALSSEGILTIIVPKRPESLDYPIPVRSEASSHLQSVIKKEQEKQTTQVSDVQNSRREHVLPVVQESQTKKESNSVSTEELLSTYNLSDSQSLLNKLERTVKLCDDIDNRQQPQVPVDVRPAPREDITQVKDTTQVSSQSSDIIKESQRLIVLDVYGFEEKELKVRVTGVNEISIEGSSEKSKGGSVSKHSFHRTFQLPDYVDLERTSTALSEEGILTIIVPKKNKLLLMNKKSVPLSTQIEQELKSREIKPTLVVDSTGTVQNTKTETQSVQESDSKRGYIVPVSVEGETEDSSASQLTSQISSVSSKTSADLSQDILSTSTSCSSIDTQVEKKTGQNIEIQQEANASNQNTSREVETREIVTKPLFNLSIIPRGHFFDDSFFQDSRSMFETILRNKMNRFQRTSSFVDDLNFFKSLRDHRITTESQMSTLSEDDHYNKIVLDVHGFNQDDLKIRALSQNEIVVEGNTEEKTGNSVSRKSFRKHFLLPGSIDLQSATSALSSDGVLNIKVPKK